MEPKPYKTDEKPGEKAGEPLAGYGIPKLYSYADYLTWTDNKRRELLDGIVRVMSGPSYTHNLIIGNLTYLIRWFVKKKKGKCKVINAPFDVRLPKKGETADDKIYTVFQPDIIVVCDPSKLDEKGCIGAPDLVVEVQSPSTAKFDLNEKYFRYEEAGVKEYWVVYPKAGVTVFLLQDNGKFDDGTTYDIVYVPDAKIPVHTIEGLEIGLKELFED